MSVSPPTKAKRPDLETRMRLVGIREEDLLEDFIRGSGPGGQKINKTSSAVQIKHLPSGMVVSCQDGRSQVHNRLLARQLLVEKLEVLRESQKLAKRQAIEKRRRQERKPPRKAQESRLQEKKHRASRLQNRRRDD